MNKKEILSKIIEYQNNELDIIMKAAHDAKEAATDPEAQAENKYDTRGLEASYLAGAQAKRAQELKDDIFQLSKLDIKEYGPETELETTALIKALVDGEEEKWFFLVPSRGGAKISYKTKEILTISINSPLGKNFYKRKLEDVFDLEINGTSKEYEIIEVY